jgi:hypothetical protein
VTIPQNVEPDELHYCSLLPLTLARRNDLFFGEIFFVFQNFVAKFLFFFKIVCVVTGIQD